MCVPTRGPSNLMSALRLTEKAATDAGDQRNR
jgi:hypothetical protein